MSDNKDSIAIIDEESVLDKIYMVRGQKVMLDFELAEIYGYSTKAFNQQVKNNIEKFDEDFRFQLTREELEELVRSKNLTSRNGQIFSGQSGGTRYLPWCFTESGIYMLMTVLRGDLATYQSKALIRTFRAMKDCIVDNKGLLDQRQYLQLSMITTQNAQDIEDIKRSLSKVENQVADVVNSLSDVVTKSELSKVMMNFSDPEVRKSYLVLDGELVEADLAYTQIYSEAKKSIFVIDNYIGLKTLVLLKDVSKGVVISLYSDNINNGLHSTELNDFQKEYPSIKLNLFRTMGKFHDRYVVIDYGTDTERIYHCGASSKDAGKRVTTITEVHDKEAYNKLIIELKKNPPLVLK